MKKLYFFLLAMMVGAVAAFAAEYTVTFDASNITSKTETIGATKYTTLSAMQDNIELNVNRSNGTNPEIYNGTRIDIYQSNSMQFIAGNGLNITKIELVGASGVNPSYTPKSTNQPSVSQGEGVVSTVGSSHVFTADGNGASIVTLIAGANSGMPMAYKNFVVTYTDEVAGPGDDDDDDDEVTAVDVTLDFTQPGTLNLAGMTAPTNTTANIPDAAVFSSRNEPVVNVQFTKNTSSKQPTWYNYSSVYYITIYCNNKYTVTAPEGYVITGIAISYSSGSMNTTASRLPKAPEEDPNGTWAATDGMWVYTAAEPQTSISMVQGGSSSYSGPTNDKFNKMVVTLAKLPEEVKLPETLWAAGKQLTVGEAEGTFAIEGLELEADTELFFFEDAEGALRKWGAAAAAAPSFDEANALVEGAEAGYLLEKGKYNIAVDMNELTFTIEKIEEPVIDETYTVTFNWTDISTMTVSGVTPPPSGYLEFASCTFTTKETPQVTLNINASSNKPKFYYDYGVNKYYIQFRQGNLCDFTAPEGYVISGITMESTTGGLTASYLPSAPSDPEGKWEIVDGKYVFTASKPAATLQVKGGGTSTASFKLAKIHVELMLATSYPETMYLIGDVIENAFLEPGVAMTRTADGVYILEAQQLFPGMMAMEPGYATFFFADDENGGGSINCGAPVEFGAVASLDEANPLKEGVQYTYEVAPGVYNFVLDLNTMSFTMERAITVAVLPEALWVAGMELTAGEAEGTFAIEGLELEADTELFFFEDAEGALRKWGAAAAATPSFDEANALVEGAEAGYLLEKGKYNIAVDMNELTFTIEKIEEPADEVYTVTLDWTDISTMTITGITPPTSGYLEFANATFVTKAEPQVTFNLSASSNKPKFYYNYGVNKYYIQFRQGNLGEFTAPEGYVIAGITMEGTDALNANYKPTSPSDAEGTWEVIDGKYVFTASTPAATLQIKGGGTSSASIKLAKVHVDLVVAKAAGAEAPEALFVHATGMEPQALEAAEGMHSGRITVYAAEDSDFGELAFADAEDLAEARTFGPAEHHAWLVEPKAENSLAREAMGTEHALVEGTNMFKVIPGTYDVTVNFTDAAAPVLAVTMVDTGVESIVADNEAEVMYFNLQGIRVENPGNGIYIRRQGNTATTVRLVK